MFMYENIHRYRQEWNKTSNEIFLSIISACTAHSLCCDIKISNTTAKNSNNIADIEREKLIMNQSKFD